MHWHNVISLVCISTISHITINVITLCTHNNNMLCNYVMLY